MKDCGEASICLALEILRDSPKKLLHLNQQRYAEKILYCFGMEDSKPVVTSMEGLLLQSDIEGEPFDSLKYLKAVGSLMYIAVGTRPEISFAISRLAQYVESPTQKLWVAIERVLRYICGTKNTGIMYSSSSSLYPVWIQ